MMVDGRLEYKRSKCMNARVLEMDGSHRKISKDFLLFVVARSIQGN